MRGDANREGLPCLAVEAVEVGEAVALDGADVARGELAAELDAEPELRRGDGGRLGQLGGDEVVAAGRGLEAGGDEGVVAARGEGVADAGVGAAAAVVVGGEEVAAGADEGEERVEGLGAHAGVEELPALGRDGVAVAHAGAAHLGRHVGPLHRAGRERDGRLGRGGLGAEQLELEGARGAGGGGGDEEGVLAGQREAGAELGIGAAGALVGLRDHLARGRQQDEVGVELGGEAGLDLVCGLGVEAEGLDPLAVGTAGVAVAECALGAGGEVELGDRECLPHPDVGAQGVVARLSPLEGGDGDAVAARLGGGEVEAGVGAAERVVVFGDGGAVGAGGGEEGIELGGAELDLERLAGGEVDDEGVFEGAAGVGGVAAADGAAELLRDGEAGLRSGDGGRQEQGGEADETK